MIQLRVNDWPNAVAWYREILALKLLMLDETRRFALLDAGGVKLAIKAREPGAPAAPSDSSLVFQVDDLDTERERLDALGVVVGPIREDHAEGFRECLFNDPEGNAMTVFAWI